MVPLQIEAPWGSVFGVGINNNGEALFYSWAAAGEIRFGLWTNGWTPQYTAWSGTVSGVNSAGTIVGSTSRPSVPFLARNGKLWYLTGAGLDTARVQAINDAGLIVGTATMGRRTRAFAWSSSSLSFLHPPGDSASEGRAVNAAGHVVISAFNPRCPAALSFCYNAGKALLWRNGEYIELGHPTWTPERPGETWDGFRRNTYGVAINDRDEVVGVDEAVVCSIQPSSCFARARAFLWRGGRMVDLGLDPARSSEAVGLTSDGMVLLRLYDHWSDPRAPEDYLLWHDGRVLDLKAAMRESGWEMEWVGKMNDRAEILTRARNTATGAHSYVRLEPIR